MNSIRNANEHIQSEERLQERLTEMQELIEQLFQNIAISSEKFLGHIDRTLEKQNIDRLSNSYILQ